MDGVEESEEGDEEEQEEELPPFEGQLKPSTAEVSPNGSSALPSSSRRVLPRSRLSLASVGGVEGLAFIASNDERIRPNEVVAAVLNDLRDNSMPNPLSPHLYRLLPIVYTASAATLNTLVPPSSSPLLPSSLASPFTFSVLYRHSNTQGPQIERAEVIRALAERVVKEAMERRLEGRVQLVGSDVTVLCWIIKSVACIGVMEGYDERHHFNVMELIKDREKGPPASTPPLPHPSVIADSPAPQKTE